MDYVCLVLVLLLFIAFGSGGYLIVRKFVHHSKLADHNETLGFIHTIVGMIYAILLGFTIMLVWDQYRQANDRVDTEASRIANLFRSANGFSEPMKSLVQNELLTYTKTVVEKEWHDMATRSHHSEEARDSYNRIWKLYTQYHPTSAAEIEWLSTSIDELKRFGDARRLRLLSASFAVPTFTWFILIFGAIVTIGFCFLFGIKNPWSMVLMSGGLALIIALVLILIDAFNHPYSGFIQVSSEAFQMQLKHLPEIMGR